MCKKFKLAKFVFGFVVCSHRLLLPMDVIVNARLFKRTTMFKDNVGYVAVLEAIDGALFVVAPLADSVLTQTFDTELRMTGFNRHDSAASVRDEMREWILARYS